MIIKCYLSRNSNIGKNTHKKYWNSITLFKTICTLNRGNNFGWKSNWSFSVFKWTRNHLVLSKGCEKRGTTASSSCIIALRFQHGIAAFLLDIFKLLCPTRYSGIAETRALQLSVVAHQLKFWWTQNSWLVTRPKHAIAWEARESPSTLADVKRNH